MSLVLPIVNGSLEVSFCMVSEQDRESLRSIPSDRFFVIDVEESVELPVAWLTVLASREATSWVSIGPYVPEVGLCCEALELAFTVFLRPILIGTE